MSEVLSQSEIDALLKALDSGEVDAQEIKEDSNERKVKKYDFRNPQKIAKEQLRTLEIIHENYSRLLQTFLSGYLRAPVKISVLTVDQYAYSEFSNSISNPAFLSIVKFKPLNGEIIVDMSPKTAFAAIDRLLGGDGENVDEIRTFTEIELTLLKRMMNKVLDLLKQAWENVIELNPILEKIETNSQFAQIISPTETVALVTMNISIGKIEGMINLCIPHLTIEPILNKLSTKFWFSNKNNDHDDENTKLLEKNIKNTLITMKAQLGSTKLTVREILDLEVGDVIKLNEKQGDEVKILVKSNPKFHGIPGVKNKKMSVKITRVVKDGEETDDQ
ncbi:flagellar motor switch protein FliM [Caldisalinibacter kiritimatiensis]|uniref:Flagellar motor switch protein FliM n=1 Tax=Caldisalinibacter kiritimatiensis TaxID=1304284 RepID=R1CLX9_9FIRM|nr:flagellar motor switch protein FliM [Caldisalinibacter kiritimatiensis]EOC99715.1 Flagellar motor switch protein FliM [Caldisalinibacter kiritimatiensis]